LIKTTKNKVFGGFASISWNSTSNAYLADSNAFVFSVDLNSKYNVEQSKLNYSICCHSSYGPNFGGNIFYVQNNDNTTTNSISVSNSTYPNTPKHSNGNSMFIDGDASY
jgi:hypothetical protein